MSPVASHAVTGLTCFVLGLFYAAWRDARWLAEQRRAEERRQLAQQLERERAAQNAIARLTPTKPQVTPADWDEPFTRRHRGWVS